MLQRSAEDVAQLELLVGSFQSGSCLSRFGVIHDRLADGFYCTLTLKVTVLEFRPAVRT